LWLEKTMLAGVRASPVERSRLPPKPYDIEQKCDIDASGNVIRCGEERIADFTPTSFLCDTAPTSATPESTMATTRTFTRLVTLSLLGVAIHGLVLSGCEATRNDEKRRAAAEAQHDSLGGDAPVYGDDCLNGVCTPDPGSRHLSKADCDLAEKPFEFLPIPIMDVEHERTKIIEVERNGEPEKVNVSEFFALHSYTYDDDTAQNLEPHGWEPKGEVDPWARCEQAENHVLHLKGGPFLEWGGGIGRSLRCMNGNGNALQTAMVSQNEYWAERFEPQLRTDGKTLYGEGAGEKAPALDNIYCHTGDGHPVLDACVTTGGDPLAESVCPELDRRALNDPSEIAAEERPLIGVTLDLSEWEGVSFWARRGPSSQAGIRLLVGDKTTDDDISAAQTFANPEAEPDCRRTIECACKRKDLPCTILTKEDAQSYRDLRQKDGVDVDNDLNLPATGDGVCWDPETEPPFGTRDDYQYCGESACVHQSDSAKSLNMTVDPLYYGTQCREFSFRGSITSKFCFDPDSALEIQRAPMEPSQTCGDHWMYSVRLSHDWEFYTVPFKALLQQGWAKRSYWLDLTAVSMTRITWDRGYLDIYLDDVRFYRRKK
jgi:hypothetical protein